MLLMYLDHNLDGVLRPTSQGYVLVNVTDKSKSRYKECAECAFKSVVKIENEMIKCVKFISEEFVLDYVRFTDLNKFTTKLAQKVGGLITGNMTCWFKNGTHSGYDDLKLLRDKNVDQTTTYDYVLKGRSKAKISQYHHLHVRLIDIFCNKTSIVLEGEQAYLAEILDRYSDLEALHATFWTYYFSLPDRERELFMDLARSYGRLERRWLKKEGVMAKQAQNGTAFDLSKIFELNVLENRVDEEIDWNDEKSKRLKPKVVDASYGTILEAAISIFADGKFEGGRPLKMTWEDYWLQRSVIMPGGAVHSRYQEDRDIYSKLPRAARNKKGFSAALPYVEHNFFLNRRPEITANVSTKYEWGKTRALYGCDYTSHVHADFGLMACEDTFPSYMPTGSRATPSIVKREILSMTGIPFCYDFDDFNSQHSIDGMKAVIDAWLYVHNDQLSDEQKESVVWTRDSISNMFVDMGNSGELYHSQGTLFSGWRLTSFMNTALNAVYLRLSGISELCYKSLHNGDDVYASASNLGAAIKVIDNSTAIGARAQEVKMNIGTIAEFLRMDVRAKDPTMSQYLTRGCATFVHSRIESEAPFSYKALVSAYKTRRDELISRGANCSIINKCYRKQLYFARSLFNVDKDTENKFLLYDLVAGGITDKGVIEKYAVEECVIEHKNDDGDEIKTITRNGISDYTRFLKKKFPTIQQAFSYTAVENSSMRMYNVHKLSITVVDADVNALLNERALRGAWSNIPGMTMIHKVRMGISNIVLALQSVNPALAHVLEQTGDPIKWMRVLL